MSDFDSAIQIVHTLLKDVERPDAAIIREKAAAAANLLRTINSAADIDEDRLVRELECCYSIWIDHWSALDAQEDHIPWLDDRKAKIDWRFWRRYERYLREEKNWPPRVVNRLDEITDDILQRLEDPARQGGWDRRGMVVGNVQSGKTANYVGLINKAADTGYRLIIIMAGLHNSLRSQTQWRLDEGFLGFDTQKSRRFQQNNPRIGVGRLKGVSLLIAHSLTSNANDGDFNQKVANQVGIVPGGSDPVVLVVKKHKSVLNNLINWALHVRGEQDPISGRRVVRGVPLLLIDDEADNASINTLPLPDGEDPSDYDVSAINGKIRELLHAFQQSAYIGYTATPFANIFISCNSQTEQHGEDIFPRSFIINIPPPSNYVGPSRVFGLESDSQLGIEGADPLPIIRRVTDAEAAFPTRHKKTLDPKTLPDSLKEAMCAFVLTCAARRARGQTSVHNSMLIHVTRFVDVQHRVAELVSDELVTMRRLLTYGEGAQPDALVNQLEQLWRTDFESTTRQIEGQDAGFISWEQVRAELTEAITRIRVKEVNGSSKDTLEYVENDNGISVIAIGGDKLSRGLTLEGLSVSYYLRASNMYDTLMQMGRWFGYRPGYLDLCRLYTTHELVRWYRHIALADEELRQQFDHMAAVGATPADYALRVRTHPDGLLITAINKMRAAVTMELSYAGQIAEVTHFHKNAATVSANLNATVAFLSRLGEPKRRNGRYIWRGVTGDLVAAYLSSLQTHPQAEKASGRKLGEYIEAQLGQDELVDWTVALISTRNGRTACVGKQQVGLVVRNAEATGPDLYSLTKARILNPPDEYLDFEPEQVAEMMETTRTWWQEGRIRGNEMPTVVNPRVVRQTRSPRKGMLILYPLDLEAAGVTEPVIGYAVSFPESEKARKITYRVGDVILRQLVEADEAVEAPR